jgi:hypothetical protein
MSEDFVAGSLAASVILNNEKISPLLEKYILVNDNIDNIRLYYPDDGKLGIWVRDTSDLQTEKYYLFQFNTQDFIIGFIDTFNKYNKDFRYYILGPPFSYDYSTNKITKYDIDGYDIVDYTVNVKIPAPITPYYIEEYEDDPYGIDYI